MALKRYLIEIGQGVDMHGGNQTNAALKAIKDATHHCCMAGIYDIYNLKPSKNNIFLKIDIYTPNPEAINIMPLKSYFNNIYDVEVDIHNGGASAKGLHMPEMGPGDNIIIVLAVLTVYINIEEV